MSVRIALVGGSGRMGQAIGRLAADEGGTLVTSISEGEPVERALAVESDVIIDFSAPEATRALLPLAARASRPVVVGTTGFAPDDEPLFAAAAQKTAVFVASNMSVGVYVLGALVQEAIRMLGASVDVEIVEAHHRRKVDAPSGTAITLAELAKGAIRGAFERESQLVFGRSGRPGARGSQEIGVLAMRGGDVVGDHHVHLLGDGERLELVHRATNRDLFARGALRAARFLVARPPGRYGMADLFA